MKKIGIIGHFGYNGAHFDGQTIKTLTLAKGLKEKYGNNEIKCFDTHGLFNKVRLLLFYAPVLLKQCENIIMLPAQKGVLYISKIILFWNRFYKRKIHYCVIGGWLPTKIKENKRLATRLKQIDFIYVETQKMKSQLIVNGFTNVVIMPNCKFLPQVDYKELKENIVPPFKLCIFSRITEKKGIKDAVDVVNEINMKKNKTVFTLDIYGPVDAKDLDWFDSIEKAFGDSISYKGTIPYENSVSVLKHYFLLLFPTKFFTEGIPGTIIDAFFAGVPALVSRWESCEDIIKDKENGLIFNFGDNRDMEKVLMQVLKDPTIVFSMRKKCIESSHNYTVENAIDRLVL